jgi:hypothetical protein
MKCSQLISDLAEAIKLYGDIEVKLGIVTNNGDWQFELNNNDIGVWDGKDDKAKRHFELTLGVEDVKEFKKLIK